MFRKSILIVLLISCLFSFGFAETENPFDQKNVIVAAEGKLSRAYTIVPADGFATQWRDLISWTQTVNSAQEFDAELRKQGDWVIPDNFDVDLDNPSTTTISIRNVQSLYTINFSKAADSGRAFISVTWTKPDGVVVECVTTRKSYALPNFGTWISDFKEKCGISFFAEWETFATSTDVEVHYITFTNTQLSKSIAEALAGLDSTTAVPVEVQSGDTTVTVNTNFPSVAKEYDAVFRVLDASSRFEFIPATSGDYLIAANPPYYFDEDDSTGKERSLIIHNREGKIQYIILLFNEVNNDFHVYKPINPILVDEFINRKITVEDNFSILLDDVVGDPSRWQKLEGKEVKEYDSIDEFLKTSGKDSLKGAGLVAATSGTLAVAAGTEAAIAGGSFTAGSLVGGSFGLALLSTPPGWVIGAAAAVVIVGGYGFYYTLETDTDSFDNGNLLINYDNELFSGDEFKVNLILVKGAPGTTPPAVDLGQVTRDDEPTDSSTVTGTGKCSTIIGTINTILANLLAQLTGGSYACEGATNSVANSTDNLSVNDNEVGLIAFVSSKDGSSTVTSPELFPTLSVTYSITGSSKKVSSKFYSNAATSTSVGSDIQSFYFFKIPKTDWDTLKNAAPSDLGVIKLSIDNGVTCETAVQGYQIETLKKATKVYDRSTYQSIGESSYDYLFCKPNFPLPVKISE